MLFCLLVESHLNINKQILLFGIILKKINSVSNVFCFFIPNVYLKLNIFKCINNNIFLRWNRSKSVINWSAKKEIFCFYGKRMKIFLSCIISKFWERIHWSWLSRILFATEQRVKKITEQNSRIKLCGP